jgi:hypothetical protein
MRRPNKLRSVFDGGRNAVSNIATQYNYVGISVVLVLWEDIYGYVPAWASSLLTSTGFELLKLIRLFPT